MSISWSLTRAVPCILSPWGVLWLDSEEFPHQEDKEIYTILFLSTCTLKLLSLTILSSSIQVSISESHLPWRSSVSLTNSHWCCSMRKLNSDTWSKNLKEPFGLPDRFLDTWLLGCSFHNLCLDVRLTKPSIIHIVDSLVKYYNLHEVASRCH